MSNNYVAEWMKQNQIKPCPALCPGGAQFNEMTEELDRVCPVCRGYSFVWEDGTPIDSKPERADPFGLTTRA
jgi:hypothetical protein